jgi:hypothetical protein
MLDKNPETKLARRAKKKAVLFGALTGMLLSYLISLIPILRFRGEMPLAACFLSALGPSVIFTFLGGIAGSIGANLRNVTLGALISAMVFCSIGLFFASMMAHDSRETESLLYFLLFCCTFVMIGALCSGVGAIVERSHREFEGKRFWPQFTLAELMAAVFLIAVLLSCVVSLMQIATKI